MRGLRVSRLRCVGRAKGKKDRGGVACTHLEAYWRRGRPGEWYIGTLEVVGVIN